MTEFLFALLCVVGTIVAVYVTFLVAGLGWYTAKLTYHRQLTAEIKRGEF